MIPLAQVRPYTGDMVAPSPNHGARRARAIEGIVLHATADRGDEAFVLSWMRSSKSRVSCHLFVARDGRVTRLVGDRERAWHAAHSRWRGKRDVNSYTLGIEIANRNDGEPFTDAQYAQVAAIVAHYCQQGISLDDVVSHGDIAVGRAADPLGWDWARLRAMVQQRWQAAPAASLPHATPLPELPRATPARDVRDVREGRDISAPRGRATAPAPVASASTPGANRAANPAAAAKRMKPVFRSRTIWVNGLTVLASGSMIVGEVLDLAFSVGLTLPEEITMWALFSVGVVNIILRFQTNIAIGGPEAGRMPAPAIPPRVARAARPARASSTP